MVRGFPMRRQVPSGGGFTLLEILLVIALIGLLGGFLLTDWGNVADSFGRRNWREAAEEAFRRGHFLAETRDGEVRLRFDREASAFVLEEAENGAEIERLEAPGIEELRLIEGGSGRRSPGRGNDRGFAVLFGADASAEPVVFEVRRSTGTTVLRNHPFSGRLVDEGEEVGEKPLADW